jgi:hypothetical protein
MEPVGKDSAIEWVSGEFAFPCDVCGGMVRGKVEGDESGGRTLGVPCSGCSATYAVEYVPKKEEKGPAGG